MTTTRGIRNHNPGNIRRSADKWQGLAPAQTDDEFFVFAAPKWGIRAIARLLIAYQDRHGIQTVAGLIARWAPAQDGNPTPIYAKFVARAAGVEADQPIDAHAYGCMRGLVEGIIRFENAGAMPYDDVTIDEGLRLAGIEAPVKPVSQSREIRGQQAAAAGVLGTSLSSVADTLQSAAGQLQPLAGLAAELKWLFIALTVAGIAYTVYARLRAHNEGVR